MTDGIIQKVINKEIEDLFLAGIEARQIEQIKRFTDKLQQELIEKIKQLLPPEESITNIHGNYTGMFYRKHIITQLIGDNQE